MADNHHWTRFDRWANDPQLPDTLMGWLVWVLLAVLASGVSYCLLCGLAGVGL